MFRNRDLLIGLVLGPSTSLVCISPKPALGDHLPTEGDVIHLDLNAPGVTGAHAPEEDLP